MAVQTADPRMVTIYDSERNPHEVSRLNALDLVRSGKFFWKLADVNKPRREEDGPEDPKAATQIVYDADGKTYNVSTPNARDMVASGKYFWTDPTGAAQSAALDKVIAAADALARAEAAAAEQAEPVTKDGPETLTEEAKRVTGSADVKAYLDGFSTERLRDIFAAKFGEKPHHRLSKETIIQRILEHEAANNSGEDQAEA